MTEIMDKSGMPKKKRGRPATGRDPLISIRVPQAMIERLRGMRNDLRRQNDRTSVSDIAREAIHIGLDYISGEKLSRGHHLPPLLRPTHSAEIHEAGHVVAAFLFAGRMIENDALADYWVKKVVLLPRGGGKTSLGRNFCAAAGPRDDLRMTVAGAVADSVYEHKPFWDVWNSSPCAGDRRSVRRTGCFERQDIEDAAVDLRQEFEQPDIWEGLLRLSQGLTYEPRSGRMCWDDFNYGRENWQAIKRDRVGEL